MLIKSSIENFFLMFIAYISQENLYKLVASACHIVSVGSILALAKQECVVN